MKKIIAIALAGVVVASSAVAIALNVDDTPVLKVANWAEYIAGGDEDSELLREFEVWYKEQTGEEIRVEYCTADDNETLYNMIKMGDSFDLVCPSEYMIMKLAAEGYLQKLPDSFFDASIETNYYAKHVSPYISRVFAENEIESLHEPWSAYAAGYMWGTTGFIYNPEIVKEEDVSTWNVFVNKSYANKITAKNNIRDTYFVGLAMYYEKELLAAKSAYNEGLSELESQYTNSLITEQEYETQKDSLLQGYQKKIGKMMNDTSEKTMNDVKKILQSITGNLYGFETDEGKNDMIASKISVNYQWSGDGVYIMDYAAGEIEDEPVSKPVDLHYSIPDSVSNLWFDGWAIPKSSKNVKAATMFINFLSRPDNAVENMDYIGYTSCIAGTSDEQDPYYDYVFDNYVLPKYTAKPTDTETTVYDVSYYFGEDHYLTVPVNQTKRQLFAQYPDELTLTRCVAMQYFTRDANTRANMMWSDITFL